MYRNTKFLALFGIAVICVTRVAAQSPPAQQAAIDEREQHWREDLQFLTSRLKASGTTVDLKQGISSRGQKDFAKLYPNFDAEISSIMADIPKLPDAEILLRLMRLIASADVAHNTVQIPAGMGFLNRLPVEFEEFADGLAVVAATPDYSAALGTRVVSIGGKTPDQYLSDLAPYVSYENDVQLRQASIPLMTAEGVLTHFGMIGADGTVELQLENTDAMPISMRVPLVQRNVKWLGIAEGLHAPVPLANSHTGADFQYYWYQYLPESRALFIQYNVCENDTKLQFADFSQKLFADADGKPIKRVVIDLRWNGGGDSRVIGPLKSGLKSRSKSVGRVYVLIGPYTFSSAVDNAKELHDELRAPLVGEPTGGMPGGYGEVKTVTLPNSKLVIRYTSKYFGAGPATLEPNIAAPLNVADFVAGRDPALEAVLRAE